MRGFGGGMGGGWLIGIILIGIVIWAVMTLSNGSRGRFGGSRPRNDALNILKERYAKGEISREEFEDMKQDLQDGVHQ